MVYKHEYEYESNKMEHENFSDFPKKDQKERQERQRRQGRQRRQRRQGLKVFKKILGWIPGCWKSVPVAVFVEGKLVSLYNFWPGEHSMAAQNKHIWSKEM